MSYPMIPATAPFSPSQRAWLNGFFAGLVGAQAAAAASRDAQATIAPPRPAAPDEEEDLPWHDPAMPMDQRLALAEGREPRFRLMAAMAQLDCGSCGYLCRTYAQAIATGAETDLTRCTPGGSATAKKLKELVQLGLPAAPVEESNAAPPAPSTTTPNIFDRKNPFPARLLACRRLNAPGSAKDTRHIELGLAGSGLAYKPGDALGILPENCPDAVVRLLELLKASGAEDVSAIDGARTSLFESLLRERGINRPTFRLLELLLSSANTTDATAIRSVIGQDLEPLAGLDIADVLTRYSSARPSPEEFITALPQLQPRLYSISSTPLAHPDQVHLTVCAVRYVNAAGTPCKGTASTYLADRVRPGQKIRVFLHPSKHFALPMDGGIDTIMIGPGTGIAPFRAFLHHRRACGDKGRNWLFFGDQHEATDFLYRDELQQFRNDGTLTRLDTAFSRDQQEKLYVQHRMIEHGREIWDWLRSGAHLYVCGDARRMAKDVDAALQRIISEHGRMTLDQASQHLKDLAKAHRYQRDVY